MLSQVVLSLFLLFAISRVLLQVQRSKLTLGAFLFWSGIFIFAIVGVLEPKLTSYVARLIGIGRGADVVIYASIALLFYLIFRLSIGLEEVRREITEVVRQIALDRSRIQKSKPKKRH